VSAANRRSKPSTIAAASSARFSKYAFQQDWIAVNPIEKMPYHKIAHRRGSARTLSAAESRALMDFVEAHEGGRLVPFFALCLFAGIRPCVRGGEILKLKASDVRLDTGVILVEPEVSKVRMKRNVTIQPNLDAWLRAYQCIQPVRIRQPELKADALKALMRAKPEYMKTPAGFNPPPPRTRTMIPLPEEQRWQNAVAKGTPLARLIDHSAFQQFQFLRLQP
jgi:integrase